MTWLTGVEVRQKTTEVEELTWFKLGEAVFVLVGYTIDPARNGKTNSQHIPDTEEYMTEIKYMCETNGIRRPAQTSKWPQC